MGIHTAAPDEGCWIKPLMGRKSSVGNISWQPKGNRRFSSIGGNIVKSGLDFTVGVFFSVSLFVEVDEKSLDFYKNP